MNDKQNFALLAPVPYYHLDSGITVATETGYVCFGSQSFDVFSRLNELRGDEDVPVMFYPSELGDDASLTHKVSYVGWYTGWVISDSGKAEDDANKHRPPTVDEYRDKYDSHHHWAIFWRVRSLHRLPDSEHVAIGTLSSYQSGKKRLNHAPRGPAIVARPAWLQ